MSVTEGTFVALEDGLPGRVHGYVVNITMVIGYNVPLGNWG